MSLHLRFLKVHKMFHSLVHTNHKSPNHHCMKYIPKKKRKYMPGISVSFFINYNELKKLINFCRRNVLTWKKHILLYHMVES